MRMRQLMYGYGRSRRTIVSEEFAVDLVVAGEIIHVHKIGANFDHIFQIRPSTLQNVANVFDYRAGLQANVESCCAKRIDLRASDGIVSTPRAGARDKQKVTRTLDVWIFSSRHRFPFDDFALGRAHLFPK